MREKIRELVIKAITDTDKLTEVVDELCLLSDVSEIKVGDTVFCEENKEKLLYKGEYEVTDIVSFNEIIVNRSDDPEHFPRINPNVFTIKRHYR